MKEYKMTHADIIAIEARAHAMRAQAMRDMVAAASKWVARRFTAGRNTTVENMA